MEPSFFLSYWRPWEENSSFVDSWGNYIRDRSMIEYGADLLGDRISESIRDASSSQVAAIKAASDRQTKAISRMSEAQTRAIRQAAESIGFKVQKELSFLNRRLDVSLEQQRLSLMLQKNISELLMIPDSEKERQQAITLGIQFFVNASKDPDLFDDALEEFLKAEQMKKQDYFVLHRIGCIYLYTEKHLNPLLAFDYFARAGKYASVESNPDALRLANILTNSITEDYSRLTSDPKLIMSLAADSYEKAALASYIVGDNEKAVSYQEKAFKYEESAKNSFTLAKYLIRSGNMDQAIKRLDWAIDKDPVMIDAVFCDADITEEPEAIELVNRKNSELENRLEETLLESFQSKPSGNTDEEYSLLRYNEIATLDDHDSYVTKAKAFSAFKNNALGETIESLATERDSLADKLESFYNGGFITLSDYTLNQDLLRKRVPSVEEYQKHYLIVKDFLQNFKVKVGDKVKGGIIIQVDSTGRKGLMCADRVIGPTPFFRESDGDTIVKIIFLANQKFSFHRLKCDINRDTQFSFQCFDDDFNPKSDWFIKKDFVFLVSEECKKCRIGNYNDWYIPTFKELLTAAAVAKDIITQGMEIWTSEFSMEIKSGGQYYWDTRLDAAYYDKIGSVTFPDLAWFSFSPYPEIADQWKDVYSNGGAKFILPVRHFNFE